ncbi:MAG: hypothetical protein ACPG4N_13320, partial [Gammaproteobacteria bacterium]
MIRAGLNMRHVTVHLMREDLPHASYALAELETFVPDERPLLADALTDVPGLAFRERISRARSHLDRLIHLVGDPGESDA